MMSVAFRRESDEEHKEPRFELPVPQGPNLVTKRGLALIAERIAALETELDSAEGDDAEAIRRDLRYWHTRRTTALVTSPPPDGSAGFGSRVSYTFNGKSHVIDIVGDDEADPAAGRIAFSAPLARAIMGAEPGEKVSFADRVDAITVKSIEAMA